MTIKKNIEISVESATRKVFFEDNFLGLTGENLQGYVVFSFKDTFVSGVPRVEIIQGSDKYIITDMETDTEDETYKLLIKSSLLTTSNVQMQLVITESAEQDSIPIFKSKMFSLYVAESINAEATIPEEYAAWIDTANAKIAEINEKLEDVDTALGNVGTAIQNAEVATSGAEKVNISSSKSGKTTTVITTNRNGEETSNEVLDGNDGEDGLDGIGLQFIWQGTKLGIKRENDSEYAFTDLQGQVGPIGPQGNPFQVKKTYATIELMVADYDNMEINDYVMISGSIEDEDNATLWVKTEQEDPTYKWQYLADFSGASGVVGPVGATPNIQIGTVTSGDTPSVTRTGTNEEPILNFVLQPGPTGATGPIGATGNGVQSISKTSTSGLVDTYTITYTNGSTTTFNVSNGKGIVSITKVLSQDNIDTYRITYNDGTTFDYEIENGSVTQTQFDELEEQVEDLERNQKTGEATGTEIDLTDAFDTKVRNLEIDATETTQNNVLLPSEYTEVDYIESSGTQYIDTNIKPTNNTKIEYRGYGTSVGAIFGSGVAGSYTSIGLNVRASDNGYRGRFKNSATTNANVDSSIIADTTIRNFIVGKDGFYIDNNKIGDFPSYNFTDNNNVYLFAFNGGSSAASYTNARLYNCKIYENNILVRDFIPCYRNSDNVVGLYDVVNGVFYTNQGTGSFTYGSAYNTPTPSPEYPQDVETMVGYRNLFDKDNFTYDNYYYNDNGELVEGVSTGRCTNLINVKPASNYIINGFQLADTYGDYSNISRIYYFDKNQDFISRSASFNGSTKYSFITPSNCYYVSFQCNTRIQTGSSMIRTILDDLDTIQLTEGTEEKPYVPYGTNYMVLDDVGKNKFHISSVSPVTANITYNKIDENKIVITNPNSSSTYRYVTIPLTLQKNTTYYFKSNFTNSNSSITNLWLGILDDDEQTILFNNSYSSGNVKSFNTGNYENIKIRLYTNGSTAGANTATWYNIQITTSNNDTYEPYQHKQYPISLGNQELLNKGDYVDKIIVDESTGESYIDKRWGKVVLDGSENWALALTTANYARFDILNIGIYNKSDGNDKILVLSNYFEGVTFDGRSVSNGIFNGGTNVDAIYINVPAEYNILTVTDFKNWLSTQYNNGTPVEAHYVLATPQLIPIDNPNIKLLNGVNHITNSEGAEMDIVYVKDINIYLDSINARIEALENANQG